MVDLNHYLMKEIEIQKRISNSALKDFFEIRSNVKWRTTQYFLEFDIVLYQNDVIYAIIEIKQSLRQPSVFNIAKKQIMRALTLTECRFGIITDGDTYYLKDTSLANTEFQLKEFNQLVAYLVNPDAIVSDIDKMSDIKKALTSFFSDSKKIDTICNDIYFDDKQGKYSFFNVEKEQNFFLNIVDNNKSLEEKIGKTIYRYTSLETLFIMLNKGTYRMNGIVGMNDKSEIDYFDKKSLKIGSTVKELNDTFLSSCTSLEDDLTMWRLYGDDGKGVCLEFEILPLRDRLDNFILAPVNYAEDRKHHKALKMLKKLSEANMRFTELYKWKHFFKPYDYYVEKEIRLMFFDNGRYDNGVINRDWIKTWSHSIINPIVDFKLKSTGFPIQLKRIILGPKMHESDINKSQIDYLLSLRGYDAKTDISKIKNYR